MVLFFFKSLNKYNGYKMNGNKVDSTEMENIYCNFQ